MSSRKYSIDFTMADGDVESVEFTVDDGKSAYEIAVDNGFEGTEQEWAAGLDPNNIAQLAINAMGQAEDMSV